ncbi:MAG: hypothetical protein HOP22_13360 [Nitrospiraceae bacterium]|nr:hypothetical protein [Nitrospiraceae bacterium]
MSRLTLESWQNKNLAMDERFTITLDDMLKIDHAAKFAGADFSIIVSYHPWIIPIRFEREFRFATKLQSDGLLHWFSLPVDSVSGGGSL